MQSYKKIFIIILLLVASVFAQSATKPDSLYEKGNEAMLQENFTAAIIQYEKILEQSKSHPDLWYNLGNAYYRKNKIGYAVWAYEKGLQLAPRDKDLQFNLSLARTRVRDRIEMPQSSLILEQYRALKKSTTLLDIILIAAAIFMLGAFVYFLKRYYRWEGIWISRLILTLFLISLLAHLVAIDKYLGIADKQEVIVVKSEIEIYAAPFAKRETVIFRLHEGVKAEVTQDNPEWIEILLIDGKKGWIKKEMVKYL